MDWYNKSVQEVLKEQNADPSGGLTASNAEHRVERYGANVLPQQAKKTMLRKIWEQVSDFLIVILLAAAVVSFAVGEYVDASVILAIVVLNAALGIVQEGRAERALEALKKMAAPNARVLRDGRVQMIATSLLVPGDIVLLESGDILSADLRLIETASLRIDESSLTGESVPVEKDAGTVFDGSVDLGDRVNMAYMGSIVAYGRGRGVVVDTGEHTQIGHIANRINQIDDEQTPLQKNLARLGRTLGIGCIVICALVFVLDLIREGIAGNNVLDAFMLSVSLAVAAIPEGLPAVVTIVLAMGMKRMVQRNAIVKRLLAVETLGCVSVICSDKTGTLTQNEMTAVAVWSGGHITAVSGRGYAPVGEFTDSDSNPVDFETRRDLMLTLTAGALCNDAVLKEKPEGGYGIVGDPTEGAFVTLSSKAGLDKAVLEKNFPRVGELPFDSGRKMMTTFHKNRSRLVSYTKGAPDVVLSRCKYIDRDGSVILLDDHLRKQIEGINELLARQALRVLAVAYRDYEVLPHDISPETIENNMILAGLVGMIDPARPEARDAIALCRRAGIRPVMITGDFRDTAVAIAKDLDLMRESDGVLTGAQLEAMSDEELAEAVRTTAVYARVSPEHKVRIVSALRDDGEIAAMTGDGVNDAMALKRADIGVAMGITGTDVAKSTADMVLTDDNFASIVSAVEEGRIIYANIRKFVFFLLSCNIGEILIVFIALLFNLPAPLTAIQLLWLNLVTDSFPALALGSERGEPDIMGRPPRASNESIIDGSMITAIAVQSAVLAATVLGAFAIALGHAESVGYYGDDATIFARTVAFTTLIMCELVRAFSCRSERTPLLRQGLLSNRNMLYSVGGAFLLLLAAVYLPFMQPLFKTVPLTFTEWIFILCGCLLPFLAGELYKLLLPFLERKFPRLSRGRPLPEEKPCACKPKKNLFERIAGADPTLSDDEDDDLSTQAFRPKYGDDIPDMPADLARPPEEGEAEYGDEAPGDTEPPEKKDVPVEKEAPEKKESPEDGSRDEESGDEKDR